jgi:hypothetical protein
MISLIYYHVAKQNSKRGIIGFYGNSIKITVLWEDAVATGNSNRRFGEV